MAFRILIVCFFLLDYTMSNLVIDVVGYSAAVITNVSIFPQAYDVYIIVSTAEYNKLIGLSPYMFALQCSGCILWFSYAYLTNVTPVMVGSTTCFIPSFYILIMIIWFRPSEIANDDCEKNEISSNSIYIYILQ